MYISDEEADLLADPRFRSGYRYVFERKHDWRVAFEHAGRFVAVTGFDRCKTAAKWVVGYYRDRYGETWPDWVGRGKGRCLKQLPDGVAGPGWRIRAIDTDEFLLEVCPCGVWCRVEHYLTGRKNDIFPSKRLALFGLNQLHKRVWPMFGPKILDAVPYRTPRHVVILPATII